MEGKQLDDVQGFLGCFGSAVSDSPDVRIGGADEPVGHEADGGKRRYPTEGGR